MRCISIEVTDTFTYAVEVEYRPKRPRLYASLTIPTPEGAYEDGHITDPELFAKHLLPAIRDAKMKARQVMFLLSSGKIATRDVVIPQVKPNKIMSLIVANASEYFPVDISGYRLGYDIIDPKVSAEEGAATEEGNAGGGNSGAKATPGGMKLLVIAVPNDLLKSYYKFADALSFKILGLDYIGNAVKNMVAPLLPPTPSLFVKLDDTSSVITIFKNRRPILNRSVGYGLADALDTLSEATNLGLEECVDELRGVNYFRHPEAVSNPNELNLREDVETLANGIARVADYYNSRNEEKLECLYLTGFAADFAGLADYISEVTGLDAVVMNDFYGMTVTDGLAVGNYVSTIGAALNPIDLTLQDIRGKKKKQTGASIREARKARILYCMAAACVLASLVLTGINLVQSSRAKSKNRELTEEREGLLPIVEAYNNYQKTLGLYNEVTHIYDLTKNRNEELRSFVEELEMIMPSNAYVSSFASDGNNASISFTCSSKEEAGNLIERLRGLNSIMTVGVSGISESRDELSGVETVQFSASLTYRPIGDDEVYEDTGEEGGEE
ncbi:MAG: hypothetical protein K5985_06530 [Lachnospiraceae bacterium]|nr:hypothetical protein [Lachnospiraceae bacterium]